MIPLMANAGWRISGLPPAMAPRPGLVKLLRTGRIMPAELGRFPFRLSDFLLSLSDYRLPCEYLYSAAVAATPWGR